MILFHISHIWVSYFMRLLFSCEQLLLLMNDYVQSYSEKTQRRLSQHIESKKWSVNKSTPVINKYTKIYLKYIYFIPSKQQIHLLIDDIFFYKKNYTLQLYLWYTKLLYLGPDLLNRAN